MRRVLIVGDSHTEGYTVNDDETYARHLERLLSASGPVQVISLGVGGYSTDQEFLSYVHHGRRLKPDCVILQVCENDIRFNTKNDYWRGRKPVFRRYGDLLLLSDVPVPDARGTGLFSPDLLQKSALVALLESALRNLAVGDRSRPDANWDEGWAVTRLMVRDFAAAVRGDGARLAGFNVNAGDPKMAWLDKRLRDIFAEFAVPYLETASVYTDDFASYWVAGHWNQKGHRAAAGALAPQVRELLEPAEKK
jgi:lysophospholipase L1-like esterase